MKKSKIPFWLQIAIILTAGVLASGVVWVAARNKVVDKSDQESEKQTVYHTVTFAYLDGTVIDKKEVEHGKGVFPPSLTDEGVFRGWSTGINLVERDIEAHPVYHSIAESNLFYFDSVYVREGTDFQLDVKVGGRVSISSGELTLLYDPEVLDFLESKNLEQCTVTKSNDGELLISFDSNSPIKTETLISQLRFHAKEKDVYSTEISLKASNMKVVADGQEVPADCATINNKVFFLQEVGE